MKSRAPFARPLVYTLLILASAVFLTPFVWLVSSSLKPLEQTMVLPPRLLPYGYYASIDGQRMEVTVDFTIKQGGIVADVIAGEQAGRRVFLTPAQALQRAADLRQAHRVGPGWTRVTERRASGASRQTDPRWDVVPPDAVESKIQIRWNN